MPIRCPELTASYVLVANLLTNPSSLSTSALGDPIYRLTDCPDRVSLPSGQDHIGPPNRPSVL